MSALCRDCDWRGAPGPEVDAPARCPACGSPRVFAHAELDTLGIAHLDCDSFYASVEKRDRPELRDRPVIVGGGVRGVVTTACYIARTYGCRSAMPMHTALKLCPQAAVVRPDFAKYTFESRRIMEMMRGLTPLVQPLSLDEAWLDLIGAERLHGGPAAWTLARLQRRIERETGLTVSVGVAPNKVLAKIASDLDKPRGLAAIGAAEARGFLHDKPVTLLPGVGPAFARSLERAGYTHIGQLAAADRKALAAAFGAGGLRLHELAHGRDARPVDPGGERKSIGAETTFNEDLSDREAFARPPVGLLREGGVARPGGRDGRARGHAEAEDGGLSLPHPPPHPRGADADRAHRVRHGPRAPGDGDGGPQLPPDRRGPVRPRGGGRAGRRLLPRGGDARAHHGDGGGPPARPLRRGRRGQRPGAALRALTPPAVLQRRDARTLDTIGGLALQCRPRRLRGWR